MFARRAGTLSHVGWTSAVTPSCAGGTKPVTEDVVRGVCGAGSVANKRHRRKRGEPAAC